MTSPLQNLLTALHDVEDISLANVYASNLVLNSAVMTGTLVVSRKLCFPRSGHFLSFSSKSPLIFSSPLDHILSYTASAGCAARHLSALTAGECFTTQLIYFINLFLFFKLFFPSVICVIFSLCYFFVYLLQLF